MDFRISLSISGKNKNKKCGNFDLYAEYIMRNAGLEETQAGIKIAGRNISHLRYANDTTLMTESDEEISLDESESGE